jgi:hypothetical protein
LAKRRTQIAVPQADTGRNGVIASATWVRRAGTLSTNGMVRPVLPQQSVGVRSEDQIMRNMPRDAAVYGVDLGKNVFHIVGLDGAGNTVQKVTVRRGTLLVFFERAAPALVAMEACPGSQWFARKIQAFGHTVRIIPAQFVKPYVKSNKSDIIDAAAIAEAATRPTMRFVEVKTAEQTDLQVLHRIRDQMMANRTRLINQMRAFCLEYGVVLHQGPGKFKADLPRALANELNDLTPTARRLLADLFEDLIASNSV